MQTLYPYTILFVEDEESTRKNYVTYLKMLFENVLEAEDGEEAYEIYQDKRPDILIVDINIPKLNGVELLKKIREDDHTTKAIMLTAHTDRNLMLEAARLKLTEYLVKPVSRKMLKSALNNVLCEFSQFEVVPIKKVALKEDYYWDINKEELFKSGKIVALSNKEKKVFQCLVSMQNKTFTSDEIILYVWENYNEGNNNALKQIIKTLRLKLPKESLKNVFGVGYKLELGVA